MRRRSAWALAAVVAVSITGCAGMPTGGAVHLGRTVQAAGGLADVDVRVLPPAWRAGLAPADVVNNFLHALVNDDADYFIARTYLTSNAARAWNSDVGVTTYDDSTLRTAVAAAGARVTITAARVGTIDKRGDFSPTPGVLSSTFSLVKTGGSWKIDRLANGVVLSTGDAQRSFRLADVYYLNHAGTRLVPEQVLVRESQRGIATALISTLLDGPGDWLAPAVQSAAPTGNSLLGNVPVHDDGTADVNLNSSVRLATASRLQALSAQIVWTLRQVSGVTAVRLLADGTPLTVPGQPARQPKDAWPQYAPVSPADPVRLLYVAAGKARALSGPNVAQPRAPVLAAAESPHRSFTVMVVAGRSGQRLVLVGRHGRHQVFAADSITTPTFDLDGNAVMVVIDASGRHIVGVDAAGHVHRLAADATLLRQPVLAFRISPDGARVAAITGAGRLLVGRVTGRGGTEAFGAFRPVAPVLTNLLGLSWADADSVVVTASAGAGRQVVDVDADGYASHAISIEGVTGEPVDVAAALGHPTVLDAGGQLWEQTSNGWRVTGRGRQPVYGG